MKLTTAEFELIVRDMTKRLKDHVNANAEATARKMLQRLAERDLEPDGLHNFDIEYTTHLLISEGEIARAISKQRSSEALSDRLTITDFVQGEIVTPPQGYPGDSRGERPC